jgi:hypothetical protein
MGVNWIFNVPADFKNIDCYIDSESMLIFSKLGLDVAVSAKVE